MVQLLSRSLFDFDRQLYGEGFTRIAGIDEAGRGPWAGPVVAAAVVMPANVFIDGVNDSKKLTPQYREKLIARIISSCLDYAVGVIDHEVIDEINILKATCCAMRAAVEKLSQPVELCIIDGNMNLDGYVKQYRCYKGGDSLSFHIACASIVAKVTRDRMMNEFDTLYPGWGFAQHKGYGTAAHLEAIRVKGLSPIHRKSFHPMKAMVS